jgi:hypothetical protein
MSRSRASSRCPPRSTCSPSCSSLRPRLGRRANRRRRIASSSGTGSAPCRRASSKAASQRPRLRPGGRLPRTRATPPAPLCASRVPTASAVLAVPPARRVSRTGRAAPVSRTLVQLQAASWDLRFEAGALGGFPQQRGLGGLPVSVRRLLSDRGMVKAAGPQAACPTANMTKRGWQRCRRLPGAALFCRGLGTAGHALWAAVTRLPPRHGAWGGRWRDRRQPLAGVPRRCHASGESYMSAG